MSFEECRGCISSDKACTGCIRNPTFHDNYIHKKLTFKEWWDGTSHNERTPYHLAENAWKVAQENV